MDISTRDSAGDFNALLRINSEANTEVRGDLEITDKIYHRGDTDTAIRFPAGNTFTVETGGDERVRINNTGVGIGTTIPGFLLEVGNTGSAGTSVYIHGDTRVTGILSVGQGTITLDPNQDMIKLGALTMHRDSGTGDALLMHTSGGYAPFRANEYLVGVTTVIDSNRNFTGVNANFSGIVTFSSGFGTDVSFPDNVKAKFGAGDDLKIYHKDNGNSFIQENSGSGHLVIAGNEIHFKTSGLGQHYAKFIDNDAVKLFYDNSLKFETTGIGISVSNGVCFPQQPLPIPSNLIIDPAIVGDDTGTVIIKGDLQVDGTTTTINSTTLTVDDKNIVVASGATNSSCRRWCWYHY